MAVLTEETVVDNITVLEMGQIQVREANRVFRDGVEISSTYHRFVLAPGDDLTGQDTRVVALANADWTQDRIDAYIASIAVV